MVKAYKYRIYPNQHQRILLEKHFGCCRWVYNRMLDLKIKAYEKDKTILSRYDLQGLLPGLKRKEETAWLKEVNAQSLQITIQHIDFAFKNFFNTKSGYPKFKVKHGKQSYQCFDCVKIDLDKELVKLPKIDWIKCVVSRRFEGRIKTTTIIKTPTNKYFVSIIVESDHHIIPSRPIDIKSSIGIDTGIKTFVTCSDGRIFENHKFLKSSLERLKVLQRRASKKVNGSKNRKKANLKVARLHEKISNQRIDLLHKVTHELTKENQFGTICVEDLNIKGMIQNHNLAQAINDVSLAKFYSILEYKCNWKGINFVKINRFYPSSKTCSGCGHKKEQLLLSERTYNCVSCGLSIDRDLNAAINIRNSGVVCSGEPVELLSMDRANKQEKENHKYDY